MISVESLIASPSSSRHGEGVASPWVSARASDHVRSAGHRDAAGAEPACSRGPSAPSRCSARSRYARGAVSRHSCGQTYPASSTGVTARRSATSSWAGRRAGAPARPRPAGRAAARSSGIGAPSPSITVTISAPSAMRSIVADSVDPAPPQATISSSAKPTASPRTKRPWRRPGRPARRRRCGSRPAQPRAARRSSAASCVGVELDQRRQGRLLRAAAGPPAPGFSRAWPPPGPPGSRSGELGSTITSSAGHLGSREDLVGRGVEGRAAVDDVGAEPLEQRAHAPRRRDHQRPPACAGAQARAPALRSARACRPRRAAARLRRSSKTAPPTSGSSVWTWTFSVAWSPTTSTESPSSSSRRTKDRGVEALAGDDEVRAVPEPAVEVVRTRRARGLVVRDLRQRVDARRASPATIPARITTSPCAPASTTPASASTSSCSGVRSTACSPARVATSSTSASSCVLLWSPTAPGRGVWRSMCARCVRDRVRPSRGSR